jgi:N-acetylglucosaminyldiphosphoundecaprenol N-acetyl-beta-D-mannosaminyltransferase
MSILLSAARAFAVCRLPEACDVKRAGNCLATAGSGTPVDASWDLHEDRRPGIEQLYRSEGRGKVYVRETDLNWDSSTAQSTLVVQPPSPPPAPSLEPQPALPRIVLSGVTIHAITEQRCIEYLLNCLARGRGGVVVTPNVDHLRRARRDLHFAAVLTEADLVVADGMPLVWASRLQGTPLPQRVAGSDLISSLTAAAAQQGRSVFLLGGDPGTAKAAAEILHDRFPQLKIAGNLCPKRGFEKDPSELEKVAGVLREASPDIVYVGLGSPKQEQIIDRMRNTLPRAWWLGVGVSFSFLCGDVRRAPLWMRKYGLEWVHRLAQEPKRLFKRYVVVGLPFAGLMLVGAAARGIPNRLTGRKPVIEDDLPPDPVAPLPRASETPKPREESPSASSQTQPTPTAPRSLGRLRSLVLLGGSVRPGPLATAVRRSLLDLPMGNSATIFTRWMDQAASVAQRIGAGNLPVRLLLDAQALAPQSALATQGFSLERDSSEYRGTGGLLSALASEYDDDDLILVASAAQILLEPLADLLLELHGIGGEVGIVAHRDGTPTGIMLLTCRTLRLIPNLGFVDMKEQGLPAIAKQYDVRVLQRRARSGVPIRTLSDYVAALRALYRAGEQSQRAATGGPEDWRSTFAIIEPAATVAASARVHDSVVLAGATVEAGAVLVRSLVAPSAIVRKDKKIVDQCVVADDAT